MMIVHVYDKVVNEARQRFPNDIVRGDLVDMLDRIDGLFIPATHGAFVDAGFRNFITYENA